MLYLEDYLEMIEHLPQELRDRFTEMRELDLTVQNSMDSLEKKSRNFFLMCKRGELQNEAADAEFQNLRKEYYKVLEDADEKVAIATQTHELVERYLRRLDSELFKFKCELEADNNGITEILEKRSLEMDGVSSAAAALLDVINANQKENRYYSSPGSCGSSNSLGMLGSGSSLGNNSQPTTPTTTTKDNRYRTPKAEKRRDSASSLSTIKEIRPSIVPSITPVTPPITVVRPITPSLGAHAVLNPAAATVVAPATAAAVAAAYNLQQFSGAASNAIAAAASQAIVATQQMQQGRRTASLKASYEAIHGATGAATEFWISRDMTNAATALSHSTLQSSVSEKKHKKKVHNTTPNNGTLPHIIQPAATLTLASSTGPVTVDPVEIQNPTPIVVGSTVSTLGLTNLVTATGNAVTAVNRAVATPTIVTNTAATLTPNPNLSINENGMVMETSAEGEWSYDPNEPRYCTCNQVSYGDMVACDNDACPYEWFHYPCVGITQPPKGKWYCPKCTASMRRRNRKN